MKFHRALTWTGILMISPLPAAGPESGTMAGLAVQVDLSKWVRDLSDESYKVRENASRELWKLGEEALPVLREAASAAADPERVYRAKDLIRKIQLHITPDTDPSVISIVERYAKASLSEKSALFGRMKGRRAWRQMLKLYAAETQPEVREKLRPSLNGVAVRAASERLLAGDAAGAREFLEMAPVDADALLALAVFHRSQGTLEAELEKAAKAPGEKGAAWRLALHRAAGNAEAARKAADEAGDAGLSALMAALAGDPLPWLEVSGEGDGDEVAAIYASLAAKRWEGGKMRAADLEPLVKRLSSKDTSERGAALNSLFLLGETRPAEQAFGKHDAMSAFRHFEALERVDEALRALGIPPENPDYGSWVARRIDRMGGEDIEDQHDVSEHGDELVGIANFLERRGLHEEAFAAFSEPLTRLAKKEEGDFLDFLSELFGNRETSSGAPWLARRIGAVWAGEDAKRWEELVAAAFGDGGNAGEWWDWLGELDPKLPLGDRFDAMLAIHRLGADPRGLHGQWLQRVWKAVEAAPKAEQERLAARLSTLAYETGDAEGAQRAWDLMAEPARLEVSWEQRISHLSAAGRWADAADLILKQINAQSDGKGEISPQLHAYAAATLRLAGKKAEAEAHDHWAEKLYLGNPSFAIRIANGYAFGLDFARAAIWQRRAAFESSPDSAEFLFALKLYSDTLLETGRWKEAASTSEVLARVYASSDYRWNNPLPFMRQRLQADLGRALSRLKSNRAAAIASLDACHKTFLSDGSLADIFFPALRREGLIEEHNRWFEDSWKFMEDAISRYPESDNTRNTAAWLASRAVRRLDEATAHLKTALAARPDQPAYLDTMAEIEFARGNREKALEWSSRAVNFEPDDSQLRRQHERFRSDPLPK